MGNEAESLRFDIIGSGARAPELYQPTGSVPLIDPTPRPGGAPELRQQEAIIAEQRRRLRELSSLLPALRADADSSEETAQKLYKAEYELLELRGKRAERTADARRSELECARTAASEAREAAEEAARVVEAYQDQVRQAQARSDLVAVREAAVDDAERERLTAETALDDLRNEAKIAKAKIRPEAGPVPRTLAEINGMRMRTTENMIE